MSTDNEIVVDEGGAPDSSPAAFAGQVMSGSSGDVIPSSLDKPVLRLVDAEFKENCETAEKILSASVYAQGGSLVRIGSAFEVRENDSLTDKGRTIGFDGIERNPKQAFLLPATREFIERQLSGDAIIEKVMADGSLKRVSCPERIANNILKHGNSPNFRPLSGIARAPFIRSGDGSVCDEPGYDARSQTLYIPTADFPDLPANVTKEDAEFALVDLLEPFTEFPFTTGGARSAFLAHILTEAARVSLDRVPCFFYTSQYAGTGKSLLSEMAATIVHGSEPALRDWVDEPEMRKTLFSSAVAGDRSIAFDNLPKGHKVRSSVLCKFITTRNSSERILGETRQITVPNLAVVSLSGNNCTAVSDLARRSLVVRLDADMTSAELKERRFLIEDLRSYVMEHRVELLMSALTILRGHLQSGHKSKKATMQSFDQWSRMVRDAILWLDQDDPLETQAEETDDETNSADEAFTLLAQHFGDREFMAGDISQLVNGLSDTNGTLQGALQRAGCDEPHSTVKAGFWLRDHRDTIGGGFKLVQVTSKHKGSGKKWMLKSRTPPPNGNLDDLTGDLT
jgi:hypothetical protein